MTCSVIRFWPWLSEACEVMIVRYQATLLNG